MTTMEGDERLYRQQETPRGLAITSENGQKRRRKGSIMIRRGMPRIATTSTTAAGELLVACCSTSNQTNHQQLQLQEVDSWCTRSTTS